MKYKEINLRKFRHNLTQLKDSLASGQAYRVIERGKPLAYFIPVEYKVVLEKKNRKKDVKKILNDAVGCVKMSEAKKKTFDYEKEYRKAMEEKHLK
jgi:antitoxin (DNA-binding transcriptional repressor) of toxin-antitoxin stability system